MTLTKNSPIVKRLLKKAELLAKGDDKHKEIRTLLILPGGGMRGVRGAGSVVAFHLLGLSQAFDTVIGISAGAANGSYFLAGPKQTLLGTSIYYGPCCNGRFIRYSRPRMIMDTNVVAGAFRQGKRKLDTRAVRKSRSEFYIGITDFETGNGRLVNAKTAKPDLITVIKASMSLPGLSENPVLVNDRPCTDGGVGIPCPVELAINKFNPTDILVIANNSHDDRKNEDFISGIVGKFLFRKLPLPLKEAVKSRRKRERAGLALAKNPPEGVNIGVIWPPDDSVKKFTTASGKIRKAAETSARQTLEIFGEPDKKIKLP